MGPYYKERKTILDGQYYQEIGEYSSHLIGKYRHFLSLFTPFADDGYLIVRTGIIYLEHILESTAVIIKDLGKQPTSETQVSNELKFVCKAVFPNAQFPNFTFQQTAKCYKPDIILPSLNCAVEYKYAQNEKVLTDTIDEILIDVKGYNDHPTIKTFYAVFYVLPGIWSKQRFDEVWKEKHFPQNWKAIFVEGN